LFVARKIIGGIYFPLSFFLRHATVLFGGAWGLSLLTPLIGAPLQPWLGEYASLPAIAVLGVVFVGLYLLALRYLHLFTHDDAVEFRKMNVARLNRVIDLIAGRETD
jgi:apolipoprotein N-acyltransferase